PSGSAAPDASALGSPPGGSTPTFPTPTSPAGSSESDHAGEWARGPLAVRYRFGEYSLDPRLFQLQRADVLGEITRQAFELLRYLIEQRDRVVSRAELLAQLWPDRTVSYNALSQAVIAARRAIESGSESEPRIETVWGRGFQFVASVAVEMKPSPPPLLEE